MTDRIASRLPEHDDGKFERIGKAISDFLDNQDASEYLPPEAYIVDLPISDHETAGRCFRMLDLLQARDR